MSVPATEALALIAAAAAPFELPPLPHPDAGYAALWEWLRIVNAELSIPDAEFRWMFGGFSIPVLLLFEIVGVRKTWKLYPFLLPFWLIFGGISLGVVGGLAAAAAHVLLFPVGRIWFMLRDRRRARDAAPAPPVPAPAPPAPAPVSVAPPQPRRAADILRAALESARLAAEQHKAAGGAGQPPVPTWGAILRALGAALGGAAGAGTPRRTRAAPPPHRPAGHPSEATGERPGKPDLSAFRPDMSRFRRRPPRS